MSFECLAAPIVVVAAHWEFKLSADLRDLDDDLARRSGQDRQRDKLSLYIAYVRLFAALSRTQYVDNWRRIGMIRMVRYRGIG